MTGKETKAGIPGMSGGSVGAAVIFDMDGIIFDTEKFWLDCLVPAAEELGLDDFAQVYPRCIGLTEPETWRVMIDAYGDRRMLEKMYEEAGAIFEKRYAEEGGLPVKEGAREILRWLRERNIPVALASSTKEEIVRKELADMELLEYFDVITCGDHVARSKPAPDIFLEAAARLGADPARCFIIEDSHNGIRAAHAAGAIPLMVPDLLRPTEEIRDLAHKIFHNLTEVRNYLHSSISCPSVYEEASSTDQKSGGKDKSRSQAV